MTYRFLFLFFCFSLTSCFSPKENDLVYLQITDRNGLTETISSQEKLKHFSLYNFKENAPYKQVLQIFRKGSSPSILTTYHSNGQLWQYLEISDARAFGPYREYYPSGQIKIKAYVIGGPADLSSFSQQDWLFDGISKAWNEKGQLLSKIYYEKGQLEKTSFYFHPSGAIKKETSFSQNICHGEMKEYDETGKLISCVPFKDGKKEGKAIGYFSNGALSYMEEYTKDLLYHGFYYDKNNQLISKIHEGDGHKAIFDKRDNLSHLIEYRKGIAEGSIQEFSSTGEILRLYHIKKGEKEGEEIEYFSSNPFSLKKNSPLFPLAKLSIQWSKGKINGIVKTWYENGQMESQKEFSNNQKNGVHCSWYNNGSLMYVEEYEHNLLIKGLYYKIDETTNPVSSVIKGTGIATLFDKKGNFLQKISYEKGVPQD